MRSRIFRLGIVMAGVIVSLNAQWLTYPEQRTPLTREGRPDLAAKTPRASNKKPDLTGVWQIEPPERSGFPCGARGVFTARSGWPSRVNGVPGSG